MLTGKDRLIRDSQYDEELGVSHSAPSRCPSAPGLTGLCIPAVCDSKAILEDMGPLAL